METEQDRNENRMLNERQKGQLGIVEHAICCNERYERRERILQHLMSVGGRHLLSNAYNCRAKACVCFCMLSQAEATAKGCLVLL